MTSSPISITKSATIIKQAKSASAAIKTMTEKAAAISPGLKLETDITDYLKALETVGKVADATGGFLGVISAGISLIMLIAGDDDSDPVSKGIQQIQKQISDLDLEMADKFKTLELNADIRSAKEGIKPHCDKIRTVSGSMNNYRLKKQQEEPYDTYEDELLQVKIDDLIEAVVALEGFCKEQEDSVHLLPKIYEVSHGEFNKVFLMAHYIYSQAILATTLVGMVRVLQKTHNNPDPTEEKVLQWQSDTDNELRSHLETIGDDVKIWLNNCHINLKSNIKAYFEGDLSKRTTVSQTVVDLHMGAGFVRASIEILLDLEAKYPWNLFAVIAYLPVGTFASHGFICKDQAYLTFFRHPMKEENEKANIIIRWRPRNQGDPPGKIHTTKTEKEVDLWDQNGHISWWRNPPLEYESPRSPHPTLNEAQKFIADLTLEFSEARNDYPDPGTIGHRVLDEFGTVQQDTEIVPRHSAFFYVVNIDPNSFGIASRFPIILCRDSGDPTELIQEIHTIGIYSSR